MRLSILINAQNALTDNEVPTELTVKMVLRRGSGVPQCNIVTRMHLATITPSTRTVHGAIYRVTGYYLFLIITNYGIQSAGQWGRKISWNCTESGQT